jgi:hypothetical protein
MGIGRRTLEGTRIARAVRVARTDARAAELVLYSQCARRILSASKQCPYEATTSTRLNSYGSEERTQEDTMNPMRRSPRIGLSELYVGRSDLQARC